MYRVSVVITTRDRPGPLAACLTALAVSFPADAETIIVSDGGVAEPMLEAFVEPLRLRTLVTSHGGPAAGRNRGLAAARGEIVAFIDDDCRPRAGWLEALAAGISSSPPRATGGTTRNGIPSNAYAGAAQVILDLVAQHERATHGEERFFPANNLAFPTSVLRDLGGFDESFRTAEDRDLCRRWRQAGFALHRVPEAVVEHHPTLDLRGFVRQFVAYGRGAAQFHCSQDGSLRESLAFHLRLPVSLAPVAARCGPLRGTHLVGLLGLWEIANLAGFLTAAPRTANRPTTATVLLERR